MKSELLGNARHRADGLRARYRADGLWSAAPLDVVRIAAARHPDHQAVVARGAELTYAELDARIDGAAAALTSAGVGVGTPVVIVVGNDPASVIAVHAAVRVDAVVLLVPRSAGPAGVADIVTRTGARHGAAPAWNGAGDVELNWIDVEHTTAAAEPARSTRPADAPSFVLFTSGTTSKPKGVIHSLSTLMKASANYIAAAGLGARDRILLVSPLASVTGVVQAIFIGPALAVPVVLEDRWGPAATCDLLLSSGATWYGGPDRLLDRLLDEVVSRGASAPLRAVYLGGTALDRRIVERIEDEFGIVVMRAYGSSEAPVSTSGLRGEPREVRHADDGVALDDVEVRVGSADELTECCIRGPHTFLGYTDAADDATGFDGEWFRTGDVAELSGRRVRIVGRIKDIVIRNGLKIPAAEVDEAVARVAGVRECAAYSVPDATTGERLAVAIVAQSGCEVTLAAVTDGLLAAGLPKYKLPEELVLWDRPLPLNANGKVERNRLAALGGELPRLVAERLAAVD